MRPPGKVRLPLERLARSAARVDAVSPRTSCGASRCAEPGDETGTLGGLGTPDRRTEPSFETGQSGCIADLQSVMAPRAADTLAHGRADAGTGLGKRVAPTSDALRAARQRLLLQAGPLWSSAS